MRILDIVEGTSVDGPGLRTSIYMAGCRHACKGCHNPGSWDFMGGQEMSLTEIMDVIRENDFNVTLSGGDPLYHAKSVAELCRTVKTELGKNIWCFTGFLWEEIVSSPTLSQVLPHLDVLVDGPFLNELRDTTLRFRGSSNQRIIDVQKTMAAKEIKLWQP